MSAGTILKLILGLILIAAGLYAVVPLGYPYSGTALRELWILVQGVVPLVVIFIGILVVWIEIEELRYSRPFKKEKKEETQTGIKTETAEEKKV